MLSPLALALLLQARSPVPSPRPPPASPIRPWLITEPVPTDAGAARVTRDYLGGERTAFPDSDAAWRPITAGPDGLVDLTALVHRPTDYAASYAFTYISSPREETRTLILASADDIVAWLNGQRIHYHVVARGADTERDSVIVRLAAGWNTLLLKLVNRMAGFGFGAWLAGGTAPLRAMNRRPADASGVTLPVTTVTVGAIKLATPPVWRGSSLDASGSLTLTAWGAAPIPAAAVRLVAGTDTVIRTVVESLVPGTPRELRLELDLADLARAAATTTQPELQVVWGSGGGGAGAGARSVSAPVLAAERILASLDGRIHLDWSEAAGGKVLETHVEVPAALAGLSLDLLAAEATVNGAARSGRNEGGVVPLCAPGGCAVGDSLAIRLERDRARPSAAPRVRVHDRTYSDVARNIALLPALGDSAGTVPPPDTRAWLAAMLQPDKAAYRRLVAQSDERLATRAGRRLRDTIDLVGVAPIDAARRAEMPSAVETTWRAALGLQDTYGGATFAAGAAQYYAWLEQGAPGLLDTIRAAVESGTWSVVGGWWADVDPSTLSGESLVRLGLYGQRFLQRRLGVRARVAWDAGGARYPRTLPQIWRGLGLQAFVTARSGNDAFFWEGLDGTRLFSCSPGGVGGDLDGAGLARAIVGAHRILVPYDATIEALERREDLRRLPAFPVVRDATPESSLRAIRAARPDSAWPVRRDAPTGESRPGLYVNRSEDLLGTAELLAALDPAPYPRAELRRAWQQLLFDRSRPAYRDGTPGYDSVAATGLAVRDAAFRRLASALDTRGDGAGIPLVVFNPSSWVRTSYAAVRADASLAALGDEPQLEAMDAARRATRAVLSGDSLRFIAREVPGLGFKVFWIRKARAAASGGPGGGAMLTGTATHLENGLLVVEVDTLTGQLARIYDKVARREALSTGGRGNVLLLDGWTLDSVRAVRAGGDSVERWIEVEKPWNATRIVQRIILRRDERLVGIRNAVDWGERHQQLTVAFDWNVTADSVFYEIPYGAIGQPATPRTEAAGHRWADLSDSTYGVSLFSDGNNGWDTRGRRMRLSLVPPGDPGLTEFRYAAYPHAQPWRYAETVRRGMEFNQPLLAAREPTHAGSSGRSWSFASIADADNVYITAVKRAEETNAYVLRLVEWHGRSAQATVAFGRPVTRVRLANLLEDPAAGVQLARDRRSVTLALRPWEIVTLLVDQDR